MKSFYDFQCWLCKCIFTYKKVSVRLYYATALNFKKSVGITNLNTLVTLHVIIELIIQ